MSRGRPRCVDLCFALDNMHCRAAMQVRLRGLNLRARREGFCTYSAKTSCSVLKAAANVFAEAAPNFLAKRALSTVRT